MAGKNVKTLGNRFYGVAKNLSGNWDPQGIVCFVFLSFESTECPEDPTWAPSKQSPVLSCRGRGQVSEQQVAAVGQPHL